MKIFLETYTSLVKYCLIARNLSLFLIPAALTGCATYLDPYVPLGSSGELLTTEATSMKLSAAATVDVQKSIKIVVGKRNASSRDRRLADMFTFGFASGAGVASIYHAHRDVVVGLGLLATGTYTASSLFAPSDQPTLYGNTVTALTCIQDKAMSLIGVVESTDRRRALDLSDNYIDSQFVPAGCAPVDPDVAAERLKAVMARDELISTLLTAKGTDYSAAQKISSASANVVNTLNEELTKRAANPQAILDAARSAITMATGSNFTFTTKSTSPNSMDRGADGGPAACTVAPQKRDLVDWQAEYKRVKEAIVASINGVALLDTTCRLNAPALAALSVSQEKITLAKESTYNITIAGGRPIYMAQWLDAEPTGISHQIIGGTLVLTTTSQASGGPHRLSVKDTSLISGTKTIEITIK